MFDLNAIRDFTAVVREGSVTAAARALGAPKSTVSKRILDLEAALGVRLLERTTRALRTTPEGDSFYARAVRLLADAEEAEQALLASRSSPAGRLRISAPHLFGQMILGSITAEYVSRHPGTTVEVVLADGHVDLLEEGFDAAIRVGTLKDSGLVARTFAFEEEVIVASPALLERHPAPTDPRDLGRLPTLAMTCSGTGAVVWTMLVAGERIRVPLRPLITLNALSGLRDAALHGAGFARLPRILVSESLADGRLVRVLPDALDAPTPISIVYPSARFLSARVRALTDLLVERFPDRRLDGMLRPGRQRGDPAAG